jgi:hypothetical protein
MENLKAFLPDACTWRGSQDKASGRRQLITCFTSLASPAPLPQGCQATGTTTEAAAENIQKTEILVVSLTMYGHGNDKNLFFWYA